MHALKILIVEESALVAQQIQRLLEADHDFAPVGVAASIPAALELMKQRGADLVCMDLALMAGESFGALRRFLAQHAVPVIALNPAHDPRGVTLAFRALETGAASIIDVPAAGSGAAAHERQREWVELLRRIALRLVRQRGVRSAWASERPRLLAIGASTGGPQAIQNVLRGLSVSFPLPILIVQHMSPGFSAGFASWLGQSTGQRVALATEGQVPEPGKVLLAPERVHMELGADMRLHLVDGPQEHGVKPAVSRLFRSVLVRHGARSMAVLLSGMGRDGALELRQLRDAGAVTMAQDEATSVVHGMPGAAIHLGGAARVLPDTAIGGAICEVLGVASRQLPKPEERKR